MTNTLNIFDQLKISHQKQRDLSKKLISTSGDSPERQELFQLLKNELFAHAVAEDRFFYIPLMMTDSGLNITRHALSEHHEMDELLEQLTETEFSSPGWLSIAKKLSEIVHHHLEEEEHKFFQQAGKILDEKSKQLLAKKYHLEYEKYLEKNKSSLT
ncbi:hemerythrin domain-containing protein [Acinetobacter sp. R933-2]|uniref:hemerythrin domain-containing protein n=1 Tax=Acinetobacter sp. R933-2 TaxID=2746728 RepID=UPI0025753885|nr:hemerythrin domain-containing protein [Acinetobacter sp. R933-2]MDM1249423.1 hemerythrin domain-containing protein [Acinetobacter sp. R933-2]